MYEELLLEKKLTTDFTMGFELEGCWSDEDASDEEIQRWFDENLQPGGNVHYDGSLHTDHRGGRTFEYASPVLPVNVGTIQTILNMYKDGLENKFYTNDTCGYHHHISFPGITAEDMVWIMCKLSLNDWVRSRISEFEGIQFANEEWADDDYLDRLASAVERLDYKKIVDECRTDKYSLVNVHAHNTLEWRGPRGVVDTGDMDTILGFYKRFWAFVKWMVDTLDETEIEGVEKKNFLDGVKTAMRGNNINGFQFKKEHKTGVFSQEVIDNYVNEILSNEKALLNYSKRGPLLERIIQELFNKNRLGKRIKKLIDDGYGEQMKPICDICVKYIPYRMLAQLSEYISTDSLYNMSNLTMKRFMKTSKLDGATVEISDKLNVLTDNRSYFNPTIFNKTEATEELYSETAIVVAWNIKHLPLLAEVFYPNDYMKHFDKPVDLANKLSKAALLGTDDENLIDVRLKTLLTVFSGINGASKIIAKNMINEVYRFPTVIIPYLTFNEKTLLYLISNIREKHPEALQALTNALIENGKITQQQYDEIIVELRNGDTVIQGEENSEYDSGSIDTRNFVED